MTPPRPDQQSRLPQVEACWRVVGVQGDHTCEMLETVVHCRNCSVFSNAGEQILERSPPADYLAEQTARYAQQVTDGSAGEEALIVFRVGDEWLALNVESIVEVAQPRTVHRIPYRSNRVLLGMINLRGELQLCFSLSAVLGIAPSGSRTGSVFREDSDPVRSNRRLVVGECGGRRWAFAVDEVAGIQRVSMELLLNVPSTIAKRTKRLASAVFHWNGVSVGRLDSDRLFERLEDHIG